MKRIAFTTGAVLFVAVALTVLAIWLALPAPGPNRIVINDQVVGVLAGHAYVYIVHAKDRAVLIDAGAEPEASTVRAELERLGLTAAQVEAVLITHGHRDHWEGLAAFPNAVAWVGSEDHLLLRGDELPSAPLVRVATRLGGRLPVHPRIREVLPGARLSIGPWSFDAIRVPGHTEGSTMYRLGEVLFTGDSLLLDGAELDLPPSFLSDDPGDNARAIRRLQAIEFAVLADGHVGVANDGRERFERWLSANSSD